MIFLYTLPKRTPGISRRIAKKLGAKILKYNQLPTALCRGDFLINYGSSTEPQWHEMLRFTGVSIINHWMSVKASSNKIQTFQRLASRNVPHLEYSEHKDRPSTWKRVVCRDTICGTKGRGITIVDKPKTTDDLPDCPLYTKYWAKTHEYRVHVFQNRVIDVTQKRLLSKEEREKRGIDNKRLIRSYENGWIFSRKDIKHDIKLDQIAVAATNALGLDFCGVDILARWKGDELLDAVVCETNAAPGMVNTTFDAYINEFKKLEV